MNVQPTRLSPLHSTYVNSGVTLALIENWQVVDAIVHEQDPASSGWRSDYAGHWSQDG